VGDTVRATNSGPSAHTWTARAGAFDSGNLDPGRSFSFRFHTAGVYSFVCSYHAQMTGTITVQ
jgi:plastocyanin